MFWVFFVPKLSDLQKIVFSGASESNSFTILLLGGPAGTTQQFLPLSEGSVPGSITLPKIVLNQAFGAFWNQGSHRLQDCRPVQAGATYYYLCRVPCYLY